MTPTMTYSSLVTAATGKPATTDPCIPCPVCGGLECLCRPRFFAGQLLTEADLNRLENYIVAKNKLHNRYIHGWGVGCGMEVVCNPCGNQVIVRGGYALSPCGDDIILCVDQTVDICELITGCCTPEPDNCFPPRPIPAVCEQAEQQWILAVCYDETLSRGVPALRSTGACAPKCGCGSHGACSCGSKATKTWLRPASTQCEPVTVCETFKFVAYPAPVETREQPRGAMFDRFLACLADFTAALPAPPTGANLTMAAAQKYCADLRTALINVFRKNPGTNCAIFDKLTVPCPPSAISPEQYLVQTLQLFVPVIIEYLRGCLCSALLPPCPDPTLANCVPLATLTVRLKDCQVLRICNLEGRKFLTTFPNLQYWLSFLPYVRNLRKALERVCCAVLPAREGNLTAGVKADFSRSHLGNAAPDRDSGVLSAIALRSFTRFTSSAPGGVEAVAYAAAGLNDANGTPFLQKLDLENPLAVAIADDLLAPILAAAIPSEAIAAFMRAGGDAAAGDVRREKEQDSQIDALKSQISELQQTLDKQQMTIDGLVRALRQKNS
ncbi:MAG TPA: hypothetical protein VH601_06075 [Bryobacteraceae bacterium]